MPWINVSEPWGYVEGLTRTTRYQPGNHNVTAEVEAAFNARKKRNGEPDTADTPGDIGGTESQPDTDSDRPGGVDLPADYA